MEHNTAEKSVRQAVCTHVEESSLFVKQKKVQNGVAIYCLTSKKWVRTRVNLPVSLHLHF